jgi:hypothetical protein
MLFAILLGAASHAIAKPLPEDCVCDHITIHVAADLHCDVLICYQLSPEGPTFCNTLAPGSSIQIPCPTYAIGIRLCNGSMYWLLANGGSLPGMGFCSGTLAFANDCCGRICRMPDANGCPVFTISAAPCVVASCD